MKHRALQFLLPGVVVLLAACATPVAPPQSILRLDPAELARIDAARPGRPLSLDEIVQQSRVVPPPILIQTLRSTGTHHALSPSQAIRLREQGVAPEVLDALAEAQERWARDQATAEKVRRDTEQAAALDRARAEAERARRAYYPPVYSPYSDPFYGYPFGYPGRAGFGGIGWGIQIRR
jgi:hypothetical protein